MPSMNDMIVVLRMVADAGPPLRYNDGKYLPDSRVDGTYDCLFCGPQSLELHEAHDESAHDESCAWRLCKEVIDKIDSGGDE